MESKKNVIDDKINIRLLKFYKAKCGKGSILVSRFINYLSHNRNRDDLPYPRELLNFTGISWYDQIASFIKDCSKNGFSSWAINKFIEIYKNFFDTPEDGKRVVSIKEEGEEEYKITLRSQNKDVMIFLFLLLILDISQDKNFCNPVQKLTVDCILDLAKNIFGDVLRYKFKMAALSYLLPKDNRDVKSNLASIFSDTEELFAEELSVDNKKIKSEDKYKIKLAIINMLTANREDVRKDLANFNLTKFNYMCGFRIKDNNSNDSIEKMLKNIECYDKCHCAHLIYHIGTTSNDFYDEDQYEIDTLDSFFNFIGDDINKLIDIKIERYLLSANINEFCSFDVLIKKFAKLIGDNQNRQNNYKILALGFAILQNYNVEKLCIDESITSFYDCLADSGELTDFIDELCFEVQFRSLFDFHNRKQDESWMPDKWREERNKLKDILVPDLGMFIDKFCLFYERGQFKKYEQQSNDFVDIIWNIFVVKHDNSYNQYENVENMLFHVSQQILKRENDVRSILYKFLGIAADCFCNLSKTSDHFKDCSTILLDHLLLLVEKDTNMSDDIRNKINSFIMKTFFLSDDLKFYLKQDRFVKCLTRIVKNEKFNFYLESQNQYSFSCIKERLKSVVDPGDNKNYFVNNNLLIQYENLLQQKSMLEKQISDLNADITSGNKNYWFLFVPVFGWIACAVYYFKNEMSRKNELNELKAKYETVKTNINNMEELGCKDINSFINPEDNYDQSNGNLVKNANTVSNNKPPLGNNYEEPWIKFGYPSFKE